MGHTKKIGIQAAMIVPCSTLRARAEMPPLKDCLNLKQSCSSYSESVVRLNGCKSFGSTRSVWQNRWLKWCSWIRYLLKNVVTCVDGKPRKSRGGNNGIRACQLGEALHGNYWWPVNDVPWNMYTGLEQCWFHNRGRQHSLRPFFPPPPSASHTPNQTEVGTEGPKMNTVAKT